MGRLEPLAECGLRLVRMSQRELRAADPEVRARGPAPQLGAEPVRRPRREAALRGFEELGGLRVAGERGLVVLLGVGHHREPIQELALRLALVAAAEVVARELEPLLERRVGPREISDRAIRRAELRIGRRPGSNVGLREAAGRLELLDRARGRLDGLLKAALAERDHRDRVPGARRAQCIALLLGLRRCALVVGEGLGCFAAVDGLEDLGAIERILVVRRFARRRGLGRSLPSLPAAPAPLGARGSGQRKDQ